MVIKMDIGKFIVGIVLIFFLDSIGILGNYLNWIAKIRIGKNKKLLDDFPTWKDTRKPLKWFFTWTIAIYLNLAIYTFFSWLMAKNGNSNESEIYLTAFIIAFAGYLILLGITYSIVKAKLKQKIIN